MLKLNSEISIILSKERFLNSTGVQNVFDFKNPLKDIVNVGGFKYQITFQENAHLHNQLNVEIEFKYSGDNAPAVLQAQLCDPTPATTALPTTGPATSPGETTPVPTTAATTPVPDQ